MSDPARTIPVRFRAMGALFVGLFLASPAPGQLVAEDRNVPLLTGSVKAAITRFTYNNRGLPVTRKIDAGNSWITKADSRLNRTFTYTYNNLGRVLTTKDISSSSRGLSGAAASMTYGCDRSRHKASGSGQRIDHHEQL